MKNIFFDFSHFKGDAFGGITAGVVALPLALAFGVQSGMGAEAGLYGAMILGVFAAIFGGTDTQISGPTGPMTVISVMVVTSAIESSGSIAEGLGLIIASFVFGGLILVVFGLLKFGKYIKYIPYPVLSGFMTGIGVIIILFQLFPFLGLISPKGTLDIIIEFAWSISKINYESFVLGGVAIAIIYIFPKITKAVPSTLVALIICTAACYFLQWDTPLIGEIPDGFPSLKLGSILTIKMDVIILAFQYGLMLAALGAIDSLLTSVIADNITKTKHDSNKELIGQGIGNVAAAFFGGIPGAGATMRTVVNVNAGGRTKISGVIHGLLLAMILLGLGKLAAFIPLSVLAGILITVGIGIIDYKGLKHLRHVPKADSVIMIVVLIITVFGNLINAVAIGMVLASILFMKKMGDLMEKDSKVAALKEFKKEMPWKDENKIPDEIEDKIYIKHLDGPLFFGFASDFNQMIKKLPQVELVIIRMREVPFMDQSGLYAMEESILELERRGIIVVISGIKDQPLDMLRGINVVPGLIPETVLFSNFSGCLKWLKQNLDGENGFKKIAEEILESKKSKS
ncbi:MAG: SulP family inorganic anion transporter [Flavobacteriales bacterium]|nr:SulP family inorganic anion transporter [Flavobacteriales bacterium]